MTDRDNHRGRETAPSPAGTRSKPKSEFSDALEEPRARVCVSLASAQAWVAIRHGERRFSIPLAALSSLLDELTEAYRVASEHGLIVEAGDGVS